MNDQPMPAGKVDTEQAIGFANALHPEVPHHYVAIRDKRKPVAKSFGPGDEKSESAWITDMNVDGFNIYIHVNRLDLGVKDRKAKRTDIAAVTAFHVDVDDPTPQALDRIKAFELKPSIILFSGGGWQAFWLLSEPVQDFDQAEAINKGLADALGGDACQNVDRIMRVPGTINWPNTKKKEAGRVPVMSHVV